MNGIASRVLGQITKKPDAMGPPPELIGQDIPAAAPDATRVVDLDQSDFESLGRVPTPMPAATSPWSRDFRPGVTSDHLHYDSNDFLDQVWRQKVARPMNAIPSALNIGLGLLDLSRMLDHPKGREQAVDFLWTMARGAQDYSQANDINDGPLTPDGQVFVMAMEDIVQSALDPDRAVDDPAGHILDIMDGAGAMIKGGTETAALAARSEKFVKLMQKSRALAKQGKIYEAARSLSAGMRPLRREALTKDRIQYLEDRLRARLEANHGIELTVPGKMSRTITVDERLARGDLLYTIETPENIDPKTGKVMKGKTLFREVWHQPMPGDLPMPHATIEDGLALACEVHGPDATPDQLINGIEIIRTSEPRTGPGTWRGKSDPVPVGAKRVLENMPIDDLRGLYAKAYAYALELEKVNPGQLDEIINWYPKFAKNIKEVVGEANFNEAAVVFGITSQQSPVEQNLMDTYFVMNEVRKFIEKGGKPTKRGIEKHLIKAQRTVLEPFNVRHTIDKMSSYQRREYDIGGDRVQSGPLSIIQKDYKPFIDEDAIKRVADFYASGFFKGNTKTQTYVATLLHMAQGGDFFPWSTMDQHMARIWKLFKKSEVTGKDTDIGVFDAAGYRAAQYMTAKLAREQGMSVDQLQALLWFYSKNVMAEGAGPGVMSKGEKAVRGRLGGSETWTPEIGTWESADLATRRLRDELRTRLDIDPNTGKISEKPLLPQIERAQMDLKAAAFPMSLFQARKHDRELGIHGMPRASVQKGRMVRMPP